MKLLVLVDGKEVEAPPDIHFGSIVKYENIDYKIVGMRTGSGAIRFYAEELKEEK